MRAGRTVPVIMCSLLLMASISGCLSSDEEPKKSSAIELIVYYDATSGVLEENVQNNQQVTETGVELTFDFSYTKSTAGAMETYYFLPGDGSSAVENNAAENGEVTYTYLTHGLFDAAMGGIDDQGNDYFENITIRIDKQITWGDSNTADPNVMNIETTPDCSCPSPEKIVVESTVVNPENQPPSPINQGQTVTVTWRMLNSTDATTVESAPEQVGDGQDASWMHNQYFVEPGTWKLEVDVTAEGNGDERVNVNHVVKILYESQESIPNPMSASEAENASQ